MSCEIHPMREPQKISRFPEPSQEAKLITRMEVDAENLEWGRVSLKRSRMGFEGDELTHDGSTDDEPTDDEPTDDDSEYNELDEAEEEEWPSEDENEDLEYQQDIEEHEYTTSGDTTRTLKIRLFLTDEMMGDFNWIKNFVAECTCDGVIVAHAVARYIDRERMRSRFWENMEEPSEETCDVAFYVFDRYGRVNLKYRDHPVQKGTGVWGSELDNSPLFLIESLHVTALELRRKGLGHKVVSLLLNKAEQFCLGKKGDHRQLLDRRKRLIDMLGDDKLAELGVVSDEDFERAWTPYALVSPGTLTADIESQLEGKSGEERLMTKSRVESGAIAFWRACGFRRIGASRCFAFSFDVQHQSRALSAASDFDPRRSHAKDLEYEELEAAYEADHLIEPNKLKMEKLRDMLPLHHAALTLTDEELKAFFVTHADDEIGWDRVSNSDATILHLTACELKPLSTQWLLDNAPHADSWKTARDIHGYTPLEALREKLEKMRTRKEKGFFRVVHVSDRFEGYPGTAVACLSLLSGQDALRLNNLCLRYGCTCGECVEGLLSARMRSSLILQGEHYYDMMQEDIDDGGLWVDWNDSKLEELEPDVRRNLGTNKSLRNGFANIFQIAAECLKAKIVPTAANLEWYSRDRREWPPYTKSYLRRAGTQMGCRAVLRYMFDIAKANNEYASDGENQRTLRKEWSDLPTCRNDHEFEFVARVCGYGREDDREDLISFPFW